MPVSCSSAPLEALKAFGSVISPTVAQATADLLAPLAALQPCDGMTFRLDVPYGAERLQCLDLFVPADTAGGRAALLFAHGGGYVAGDKSERDPFYRNVGIWAARRGLVAACMNYRLAPEHRWPAAADDVAKAFAWLLRHSVELGIDPGRIFVMGHSAGATHIACWLARRAPHDAVQGLSTTRRAAGAILLSGTYDLSTAPPSTQRSAYFGEDPAEFSARSTIATLPADETRLLLVTAELDPSTVQQQTLVLAHRCAVERRPEAPTAIVATDHNHFSTAMHLGACDSALSSAIGKFLATADAR